LKLLKRLLNRLCGARRLSPHAKNEQGTDMTMDYRGRIALVTGAAGAIGTALTAELRKRGASVVAADGMNGKPWTEADLRTEPLVRLNVTDRSSVQGLVARTEAQLGAIDLLVNVAGVVSFGSAEGLPEIEWDRVIDINLKGMLYMMKYEAAAMLRSGGGSIVNNSSIFGLKAMPRLAYYVAAKHGIVGATRAVALDYARKGIRVNAVCPGPIKTASYDRVTVGDDHMYDDGVPMHRIGQPREISHAVLWLLSSQSSYVTGGFIPVDGGMSAN